MSTVSAANVQVGQSVTADNNITLNTDGSGNLIINKGVYPALTEISRINHDGSGASYTPAGTGAVVTSVQAKLRESVSVKDFGAVGDGVTDDTAAFNLAIATGKKVIVPYTTSGYVVNNISVVTNMVVEGEKSGISNGPTLIVTTNNAGAFLHSSASAIYQIEIRNFVVKAAAGITGARAFKQNDKSVYTAYAKFEGIETDNSLLKSYDGFFIFTEWNGCRDGYIGTALAQGHGFIDCKPASWAQGNQANINTLSNTHSFGAVAGTTPIAAAVDIGYGSVWTFDRCDFEALTLQAVNAQGIYGINFKNCWFERITAAQVGTFTQGLSPFGTRPVVFEGCQFNLVNTTTYVVSIGAASAFSMHDCTFVQVPTGLLLANATTITNDLVNLYGLSGVGSTTFLNGFNVTGYSSGKTLLNGAIANGSSSVVQLSGIHSASGGYTSLSSLAVSTTPVTIATSQLTGGMAFVNGYNTTGGASGWWLVAWNNAGVATVLSTINNTTLTVAFTVASGSLKMNTTAGTLAVNVTAFV